MKISSAFISLSFLFFSHFVAAQYRYADSYNRLGIQGAVNYGGIVTNDLESSRGTGFLAGLTTRANVYNEFIIIYGVNFFQSNTSVSVSKDLLSQSVETDFKATGVQLNLFAGHKIFKEYLSVEGGPVLQINSKWKPDDAFKSYRLQGYNLRASDVEDISKVNFALAGNISAGFRDLKFWFQYQYGLTNIFRGLDSEELRNKDPRAGNLQGRQEMALAGIVFYF